MGLLRLLFLTILLCAIAAAIFYCYKKRKNATTPITEPLQSAAPYQQMGNPYETMRAAVPVQSFRAEPYFKV